MTKLDMQNKYIFYQLQMPNKNSFAVCLCDAMLNGISTAPISEVIIAAMLEPPTGDKREGKI